MQLTEKDKFEIIDIISDRTGIRTDAIESTDKLGDTIGMDSLDIVELGMELEKNFDVVIEDSEVESWQTVQDIYNTLEEIL